MSTVPLDISVQLTSKTPCVSCLPLVSHYFFLSQLLHATPVFVPGNFVRSFRRHIKTTRSSDSLTSVRLDRLKLWNSASRFTLILCRVFTLWSMSTTAPSMTLLGERVKLHYAQHFLIIFFHVCFIFFFVIILST